MAGVVANKSTSVVVSSQKNQVVMCDAKSNNALIDIDTITSNNSQLMSEHDGDDDDDDDDDDAKDAADQSLQELIESELAMRIYSSKDDDVDDEPLIFYENGSSGGNEKNDETSDQINVEELIKVNGDNDSLMDNIVTKDFTTNNDKTNNSPGMLLTMVVDQLDIPDNENTDLPPHHHTSIASSVVCDNEGQTKTKKKKIESTAIGGNDVLPASRTKKTKKSKKSTDLEKENISVNSTSMSAADEDDLSNVNVKSLTQCYALETTRQGESGEKLDRQVIETGVSIKQLKSSFNKFDALAKKSVLDVQRSTNDIGKADQHNQLTAVGQNGDTINTNCKSCGKVVFQMEQTKAEGLIWHKNCFKCIQCSKQLTVDNYSSHESTLYCKPHFKELFQPRPVDESNQPVCPRKPEMIIRENQPKELPPDVVRASDKPDLGLEELSSLNVKSRFQVFEKSGTETINEIEKSPSQISVKRSPSILSKLAKFQAKGMDIGVADDSLNGIPFEESSESDEDAEIEDNIQDIDAEIVKSKRAARERPMSFTKMDDIKNRWEVTSQQGRRESQREARKEEIAGIRSRLFMGKQGKMKEMYQQAVATSEQTILKINPADEISSCSTLARSIKERFERGEPIVSADDEAVCKPSKQEMPDEEVIAAGLSRKSRSLFLEMDATAAKTGTLLNAKPPAVETPKRARDVFMGRQVSDDVIRSSDAAATEQIHVETADISNKFKFFETYKEPEKCRKQFRITPPRDGQVKMNSPEREIYRDPDVIRADDRVDQVVYTDTTKKMLSIFRQMEEKATREDLPDGPKPLKRFTPPPEDKYARATASDSDEQDDDEASATAAAVEEDEDEEDDAFGGGRRHNTLSEEDKNPNYVRASDKLEDDFLKHAQNAAKAKTLREKFEHWDVTDCKTSSSQNIAEMEMAQTASEEQSSMESAKSLRARFESLGSQSADMPPRTPKVKVNRFVDIQTAACTAAAASAAAAASLMCSTTDVICESCEKKVYPLEKVETNNKIFHKQCFRCLQCNCVLRMDTFTLNNGKLYCIPHFKQLFIARGNYDEGFGVDPHKNKWTTNATSSSPNVADE